MLCYCLYTIHGVKKQKVQTETLGRGTQTKHFFKSPAIYSEEVPDLHGRRGGDFEQLL